MTVAADEFIRRFLIHTLPDGFQRVRHCGFLANRHRKQKLALCRKLLTNPIVELLPNTIETRDLILPLRNRQACCPKCQQGLMIHMGFLQAYRWPLRPPDSS